MQEKKTTFFKENISEKAMADSKGNCRNGIPTRYVLAIVAFFGFINVYALRVNLSVAIVTMTNLTDNQLSSNNSECPVNNNTAASKHTGEFNWSSTEVGLILGAFFYGYICTQLIGGWLAAHIGGKLLLGYGILWTSLLTLLSPLATRGGFMTLFAVRLLEGLGEGVTFPAMHAIWGKWAPQMERSKLVTFTYSGSHMGTVLSLPISGALANSDFLGGWPSIFYVFGSLGVIWFIAWMMLTASSPAEHPRISEAERNYIEQSVGPNRRLKTPWRSIFTSMPVWAICVAHCCYNWSFYMMLTSLPLYMKTILQFDISQNSQLSAIPYVFLWLLMSISGILADYLRSNGYLTTTVTRKIMNTSGMVIPAVLMVTIKYVNCSQSGALTLVILAVAFSAFSQAGYNVNHLDIAPNFAGILMGISNTIATIPGFLAPYVVGVLTDTENVRAGWQSVFYISASINLFGAIFFAIFASGEQQIWAVVNDDDEEEEESLLNSSDQTESFKRD